jgi:sugar O-acyltransferase (sialic acid O-acetyltransferase NeuD family)
MKTVIAGAGTYGSVYHHYIKEQGKYDVIAFVDDDTRKIGQNIHGLPVLCSLRNFKLFKEHGVEAVFCPIGDNSVRGKYLRECLDNGLNTPGFVHESVIIPNHTKIGKGVYIMPGSIIMPFVEIEDFVMISMGVKVAHHTILREASFLSTGVNMGAGIAFGAFAFAGIGSTITTGIKRVGDRATIGAGAVIIRDVPAGAVMVGNPGQVLKYREL